MRWSKWRIFTGGVFGINSGEFIMNSTSESSSSSITTSGQSLESDGLKVMPLSIFDAIEGNGSIGANKNGMMSFKSISEDPLTLLTSLNSLRMSNSDIMESET